MIFWKTWTSNSKCGTFAHDFLKKVDLNLKMWTYTHAFLKKVELDLKMWTFTHDFLKKVDLNLKIVDLNAWGSAERGPQHEKYGPLCVIFEKRGPWPEKCGPLFCDFPKQKLPRPEKWCHLHVISWKIVSKFWTWIMWTLKCDFLRKKRTIFKIFNFEPFGDHF